MQCPQGQTCDLDSLTCYTEPPVTAKFTAISAGDAHTCAIDPSHALWCWGRNNLGQLGVGDADDRLVPTRVGADSDWFAVEADGDATCGLRGSGELWCWGDDLVGGTQTNVPKQVTPAQPFKSFSLDDRGMCALDVSGGVWCRFYNDQPQLVPLDVTPIASVSQLAVGAFHQCVIDGAQHLWCWGSNNACALGIGAPCDDQTAPVMLAGTWKQVALSSYQSCAIDTNDKLWCWGDCDQDQATPDEATGAGYCVSPTQIGGDSYSAVVTGDGHTCALRADGAVVCLGRNLEGQLGTTTISQRSTPVVIPRFTDWTAITAGSFHTCGLRASGEAWCWGHDRYGELGDGETAYVGTPTQVDDNQWQAVSTGLATTCAQRYDGGLYCWGENGAGQIGDGTTTERTTPTQVGTQMDWTNFATGGAHTCAIRAHKLYCWGDNRDGQLGLGNTADVTEHMPKQVGVDEDWQNVDTGNVDTAGVRSDGLYYWGDYQADPSPRLVQSGTMWQLTGNARNHSIFGQMSALSKDTGGVFTLGTGTAVPADPTYTGIGTSPNWTMISGGTAHHCGIAASEGGALLCWGENYYGELGAATNPPDNKTAVPAQGAFDWKYVDAGDFATCGITDVDASTPEELYCWGIAKLVPRPLTDDGTAVPQRIAPGVKWDRVSIADHHGCAIRTGGTLWCWGDNLSGEVGVGPTSKHQPVRVHMGAP